MSARPFHIAALLLLAACRTVPTEPSEFKLTGGVSAIPNLGFTAGVEQVFHRKRETSYAVELIGTLQPWDDENIIDDGNPSAGSFTQFQLGVRRAQPGGEDRWWSAQAGAVWFRARGVPNIVNEAGDYIGFYTGVGFAWQINEHLTMGPDLNVLFVTLEGTRTVDIVPQLSWRLSWGF